MAHHAGGIDPFFRVHQLGRRDIGFVRAVAKRLAMTSLAADAGRLVSDDQLLLVEIGVQALQNGFPRRTLRHTCFKLDRAYWLLVLPSGLRR
jgi:hypothetical protein